MSGPKAKPKRKMPSQKPATPVAQTSSGTKPPRKVVEAPKPKRSIPVLPIVFSVIAVLLVLAVTLTSNTGPGSEFGEPAVAGDILPLFDSRASLDLAVGEKAPVITGENFDGETVTIGDSGSPTAVVFLAHWCPHCQEEVPKVVEWLEAGGGVEGVDLVSVATSTNSARANYPPSVWLERERWAQDVVLDDSEFSALRSYGAGGFPYWVFLNADGTVAARSAGQLDIASLEQFMLAIAPSGA